MTIVEQAPCSSPLVVPPPVTDGVELVEQILEPASPPVNEATRRSSRARRWTAFARRRQYNHPRRERFVEEAAMSREMFRL
jgi:hypothetical protein